MKTAPFLAALVLFVHLLAGSSPFPMPQEPAPITGAQPQKAINNIIKNTQTPYLTSINMQGNVHPHNLGRQGGNVKRSILFAAVALFVLPVLARSAPIVGATVQTLFHTPSENQMTLRVTNASTKNITGYILSIHELSVDGQRTDFHSMFDFLANQLLLARHEGAEQESLRNQIGPPFLTPGQNYDQVSAMPTNLQDFSVMLVAVAYDDKSAEAISQDALEPLIEQREAEETAIRKANEIISANPDPQVAIKKIQNLRDVFAASSHSTIEMDEHTLDVIIEDLQNNPKDLKAYQAKREAERATWADHAKLKIGGAS